MTKENSIDIAENLFVSAFSYIGNNKQTQKLYEKIFWNFLFQCVIMGKDKCTLTFKGIYIRPLSERIEEWITYYFNCLYLFFLKHFTTEDFRYRITHFPSNFFDLRSYQLIYYGARKPFDTKITNAPNELLLKYFLEQNNLKIINEYLSSVRIIYEIKMIES